MTRTWIDVALVDAGILYALSSRTRCPQPFLAPICVCSSATPHHRHGRPFLDSAFLWRLHVGKLYDFDFCGAFRFNWLFTLSFSPWRVAGFSRAVKFLYDFAHESWGGEAAKSAGTAASENDLAEGDESVVAEFLARRPDGATVASRLRLSLYGSGYPRPEFTELPLTRSFRRNLHRPWSSGYARGHPFRRQA